MSGEKAKAALNGAAPLSYNDELDRARRDLRALQRRLDAAVDKADPMSDSYKKEVAILYEVKGLLQYTQNRIGVVKKARNATLDAPDTSTPASTTKIDHLNDPRGREQSEIKAAELDAEERGAKANTIAEDHDATTPSLGSSSILNDMHNDSQTAQNRRSSSETPRRSQTSRDDIAQRAIGLFDNESGSTIAESFDGRINGLDLGEIIGRIREYREKNPPDPVQATPTTPKNSGTPPMLSPSRSQLMRSETSDANEAEPVMSKRPIRRKRGIKKKAQPSSDQTMSASTQSLAEEPEAEFPVQVQPPSVDQEYTEQVDYAGYAFSGDNTVMRNVGAESESATNEPEASTTFTETTESTTEETGGSSLFSVETFHVEEVFSEKPTLLEETTQTAESPATEIENLSIEEQETQFDDSKAIQLLKDDRHSIKTFGKASIPTLDEETQRHQISSLTGHQQLTLAESMEADLAAIITLVLYPIVLARSLLHSTLASANRSLSQQGLGFLVGLILGAALQWTWMQAGGGLTMQQAGLHSVTQQLGPISQWQRPPSSTLEAFPPLEHNPVAGQDQ